MELGLRGRACVVTGASGGIGGATARLLAAEGRRCCWSGVGPRRSDGWRRTLHAAGAPQVEAIAIDVTEPDAGRRATSSTRASTASAAIDVLVNNAGVTVVRRWDQLTDADWQDQWELNVMAPMRLMRAAAPEMARRGWGRIVNVSSSSGKRPSATNIAYWGDEGGAAVAVAGVRRRVRRPGRARQRGRARSDRRWRLAGAEGLAAQQAQTSGRIGEEVLAGVAGRLPLGRLGTDEEIAAVIAFLCSEQAGERRRCGVVGRRRRGRDHRLIWRLGPCPRPFPSSR